MSYLRDIKYIIKRIIIGTGIALAIMFIKQNVYAYEWETSADTLTQDTIRMYISADGIFPNQTSSFSYPITYSSSSLDQNYAVGTNSGDYNSANIVQRQTPIPMSIVDLQIYLFGVSLNANQRYKLIVPYGYNNNIFSSLSNNVNETLILDPTTYSINNNFIDINSGSLAFGVENDLQESSNYPYYMYFNIQFTPTEDITNSDITISINGTYNRLLSASVSSLNTYTLSDNRQALISSNIVSGGSPVGQASYWTNNFYKPFLYTTSQQADNWYIDGNDIVSTGEIDIKGKINEIIDGQFTDDLNFPYLNGGGLNFGENNYSLTDLLVMPIEFVRSFVTSSDACSPVAVPLPGITGTFYLPCVQTFATSMLGQTIVDIIKLIAGCTIGFRIITKIYNAVQRILDPEHLMYFDDIF